MALPAHYNHGGEHEDPGQSDDGPDADAEEEKEHAGLRTPAEPPGRASPRAVLFEFSMVILGSGLQSPHRSAPRLRSRGRAGVSLCNEVERERSFGGKTAMGLKMGEKTWKRRKISGARAAGLRQKIHLRHY